MTKSTSPKTDYQKEQRKVLERLSDDLYEVIDNGLSNYYHKRAIDQAIQSLNKLLDGALKETLHNFEYDDEDFAITPTIDRLEQSIRNTIGIEKTKEENEYASNNR